MINVTLEEHLSHYPLKKNVMNIKLPAVPAVGDGVLVGNKVHRVLYIRFEGDSGTVRILVDRGNVLVGHHLRELAEEEHHHA